MLETFYHVLEPKSREIRSQPEPVVKNFLASPSCSASVADLLSFHQTSTKNLYPAYTHVFEGNWRFEGIESMWNQCGISVEGL
jgi:hypothetical protein